MNRIAFIVNGSSNSAMGQRAIRFAKYLQSDFEIQCFFRQSSKLQSIGSFLASLHQFRPVIIYVFDISYSGVIAGLIHRWRYRPKLIIDTGDAIGALARAIGRRRVGVLLTDVLEYVSVRGSDHLVVRGRNHFDCYPAKQSYMTWIPDGVETEFFIPPSRVQSSRSLTIGLVGSVTWNPVTQSCYGLELLEILRAIDDPTVRGIVVGDGSGLPRLKELARDWGLTSRINFCGFVPYLQLPAIIQQFDVAISTQTNDLPGQVRTTGKLPLYLACDRYILASRVGEAAKLLPESMLVDYDGSFDPDYSTKLVHRIRDLMKHRDLLDPQGSMRTIALEYFDYAILADRLRQLFRSILS